MAEGFPLGNWKNLMEMEETLTLEELNLIVNAKRDSDRAAQRFAAALKGIDLDEETEQESSFDDVRRRADAHLAGKTEAEYDFDMIGIEVEIDEED